MDDFIFLVVVVVAFFLLSGCSDITEMRVTPTAIKYATTLCEPNGGLKHISYSDFNNEYESCGFKCAKQTGRLMYETNFLCNNGAVFNHEITE